MGTLTKDSVESVSKLSGLSVNVCMILFNSGYMFVNTIKEPAQWVKL